ncbi:MAG: BREX-1 system adenine-specific DNA-methyltransferase PglX [Gammaproteobacteria bacterium]|nr:BREX-1 system adenine-specific DNA-methyltransferase PglX [Gammaproteobacteria bacterium]
MNNLNLRSEQIARYKARLNHLDELLERARQKQISEAAHEKELKELTTQIDEIKAKDFDNWQEQAIEQSGPMAVWDIVAQKLEALVEKIEK